MNELLRSHHSELREDVGLYSRRGRRRESNYRCNRIAGAAQPWQVLAEHAVVGPEVMTPLRNAVRFVDGNQSKLPLGQHLNKARYAQPLWSNEEELQIVVQIVRACLPCHGSVES